MGGFILIALIITAITILQVFLSTRRKKYFGLIIPCINLLCSITISLLFSDMFVAVLGFVFSVAPVVIWLSMFKACRRKINQKNNDELNKMRINDL